MHEFYQISVKIFKKNKNKSECSDKGTMRPGSRSNQVFCSTGWK